MLDTMTGGLLRRLGRRRVKRRQAVVRVSGEFLLDVLLAPAEMTLAGVQWDGLSGTLELIVEHADLPELEEGTIVSELTPKLSRDDVTGELRADWGVLGERSSQ